VVHHEILKEQRDVPDRCRYRPWSVNAIAFVIPFSIGADFWTGYAFATLAVLLSAGIGLYALGHEGLKSKFYGVPLLLVIWPYLIV
jgi:hypothetical protein